jgi:hypothetical protein
MAETFIVDFRRDVRDLLRAGCSVPVYGWLPDDVAHLPVIAVGRPSARDAGTPAVMTMTLDVTLVGRRISDEDSQAELDALADELFDTLGCTSGVKVGGDEPRRIDCHNFRPGTALIAGLDYPAYLFTLTVDVSTC